MRRASSASPHLFPVQLTFALKVQGRRVIEPILPNYPGNLVELDGACVRGLSRGALIDRAGIENINIEELFAVTISSLGKISLLYDLR